MSRQKTKVKKEKAVKTQAVFVLLIEGDGSSDRFFFTDHTFNDAKKRSQKWVNIVNEHSDDILVWEKRSSLNNHTYWIAFNANPEMSFTIAKTTLSTLAPATRSIYVFGGSP